MKKSKGKILQWSDQGFLISAKVFGETDVLAEFLTASHGRACGLVKGGQSRRLRPYLQIGNSFGLVWKGRLESQLGFFAVDPMRQRTAEILENLRAAAMLQSACALLSDALPENDANWRIYENTSILFDNLNIENYINWERELLAELGFKMMLDRCNATGSRENLAYISTKTGHAVSEDAGRPYKDKLLPMPRIWSQSQPPSPTGQDFSDALKVLEFFLETRIYANLRRTLPFSRRVLLSP